MKNYWLVVQDIQTGHIDRFPLTGTIPRIYQWAVDFLSKYPEEPICCGVNVFSLQSLTKKDQIQ